MPKPNQIEPQRARSSPQCPRASGAKRAAEETEAKASATGGEKRDHAELRGSKLLWREGWLAENLAKQLECLRERAAFGFDGEAQLPRGTGPAAATATPAPPAAAATAGPDANAQRVELLTEGLAIVLLRAGQHQAGEHSGRGRLVLE